MAAIRTIATLRDSATSMKRQVSLISSAVQQAAIIERKMMADGENSSTIQDIVDQALDTLGVLANRLKADLDSTSGMFPLSSEYGNVVKFGVPEKYQQYDLDRDYSAAGRMRISSNVGDGSNDGVGNTFTCFDPTSYTTVTVTVSGCANDGNNGDYTVYAIGPLGEWIEFNETGGGIANEIDSTSSIILTLKARV